VNARSCGTTDIQRIIDRCYRYDSVSSTRAVRLIVGGEAADATMSTKGLVDKYELVSHYDDG